MRSRLSLSVLLAAAALLSACATTPGIDADVQSFAQWAKPSAAATAPSQPVRYRFDRLPSQNESAHAAGQALLEGQAKAALARAGWQEAADATHVVSLQWRSFAGDENRHAWGGFGFGGYGWGSLGADYVVTRRGNIVLVPLHPVRSDWPLYTRELQLTVRDLNSQSVVFESRAKYESRHSSDFSVAALMVDAALDGFPNPPAGIRRVNRNETVLSAASVKP